MSSYLSSSPAPVFLVLFAFMILIEIPPSQSSELHSSCSELFSCGNIKDVGYPFWGGSRASGCGYPDLQLTCENNTTAKVMIANVSYLVLGVYPQTQVLSIARQDYSNGLCSPQFTNTTIDPKFYDLVAGYINFTLIYGCPSYGITNIPGQFNCSIDGIAFKGGYTLPGAHGPAACSKSVVIPVSQALIADVGNSSNSLAKILLKGFEIRLNVDDAACGECMRSKGVCGYDFSMHQTTCYCANRSSGSRTCSSPSAGGPQGSTKDQGMQMLLLELWKFSIS